MRSLQKSNVSSEYQNTSFLQLRETRGNSQDQMQTNQKRSLEVLEEVK